MTTQDIENDDDLLLDDEQEQLDDEQEQITEIEDDVDDDDDDQDVIGFDDEIDGADDTELHKHLRSVIRAKDKELADLRSGKAANVAPVDVGPPPSLEDYGYDEDSDEWKQALEEWSQRKVASALQKENPDNAENVAERRWNEQSRAFDIGKASIRAADLDEAMETAKSTLSEQQYLAVIRAADDPAKFMYALGKSPARISKLASLDLVDLIKQVGVMEGSLKVTSNRKTPAPDRVSTGGRPIVGGTDKELARLEKEADRTGDRTKLIAYKRQKNSA